MSQPLPPVPQASPSAKTNTLALVSLIVALVPIVLIFIPYLNCIALLCPIAAIILGIIGLTQVKKTMQRGKGMAIAGIIIGAFWIVLVPIIVIAGVSLFGPIINNIFNQIQNNLGGSVY